MEDNGFIGSTIIYYSFMLNYIPGDICPYNYYKGNCQITIFNGVVSLFPKII